jgi:leucyl-tRNA synthetase
MDEKYFPETIEKKWQQHWEQSRAFEARDDDPRPKFYALEMLPYPSGYLHMGHVRNYSIGDALAWYKRLQGFNVLHPIGWDSFGQPAEQAAIKRGVNPRDWTEENIAHMRGQMKRLGISYDWSREIAAHRPDFYKWDQWFFLKMLKRGLAYKKLAAVNWCPREGTVLSNEQSSGGVCWRCGASVEKRDLEQWFLRITDYAEQLVDDIKQIESTWPEKVLKRQRDWVGRSEGAYIDFGVKDSKKKIRVFTTRIDTIFGATAVVLSPEHPLLDELLPDSPLKREVLAFAEKTKSERVTQANALAEAEKEGINSGILAINPFSGETLPVWVANYVMMDYGTGAVMSVPAHDERDYEFAQKYSLPIRRVIERISHEQEAIAHDPAHEDQSVAMPHAFTDYGILVNSGDWSGKLSEVAIREMAEYAKEHGFGEAAVTYRIRDWGVSRQRFWGAPVPIIYCEKCGMVPVPEKDLPVELPDRAEFSGSGESPLAGVADFVNTTCPNCHGPARRDTDTMDTFVDSSWYFFRYTDPRNESAPFDPAIVKQWTPVDQYIGGDSHAVMHLIYTRFWTKFMRDIGLVSFDEPVKRLLTQGMVTNRIEGTDEWKAMSKSLGNGVDPDEMIAAFGADAARLFILFAAPVENELRWSETGIEGAVRFIRKVYSLVYELSRLLEDYSPQQEPAKADFTKEALSLRRHTHKTITRVTNYFEGLGLNTSVAAKMELSNALSDWIAGRVKQFSAEPRLITDPGFQRLLNNVQHMLAHQQLAKMMDWYVAKELSKPTELRTAEYKSIAAEVFAIREALEALVIMLAPFAPHVSEEMWQQLGHEGGLLASARWPQADPDLAHEERVEIRLVINKKVRGRFHIDFGSSPELTEQEAILLLDRDEGVGGWLVGKERPRPIVVAGQQVQMAIGRGPGSRDRLSEFVFRELCNEALADLPVTVTDLTISPELRREAALRHLYSKLRSLVGSAEIPLVTLRGSALERWKQQIAIYSFHHSLTFFRTKPIVDDFLAKAVVEDDLIVDNKQEG